MDRKGSAPQPHSMTKGKGESLVKKEEGKRRKRRRGREEEGEETESKRLLLPV